MLDVIIIDNRPVLRFGIKYFLESRIKEITLSDYKSIEDYRAQHVGVPDLIFLGVEEHGQSQQLRRFPSLRQIFGKTGIIVYDTDSNLEACIKYLRAGAHAYLSKYSERAVLEKCLDTVLDGKIYVDPIYQANMLEGIINGTWASTRRVSEKKPSLTSRQREIAMLYAQGMSTSRIATKLGLQSSTISTVKSTLYAKLKVDSVVDLSRKLTSNEWDM